MKTDADAREQLASALESCSSPRIQELGALARHGACWGNVADALEGMRLRAEEIAALRDTLVNAESRDAWLVFASISGPGALVPVVSTLPPLLQRWLVAEGLVDVAVAGPAARDLAAGDADAKKRDCTIVRAAMDGLRALRRRADGFDAARDPAP